MYNWLFKEIHQTLVIREKYQIGLVARPILTIEFQRFQKKPLAAVTKLPDSVVIHGIKNLDEKILRYLYQYTFPKVNQAISRQKGNSNDANDIFQDSIIDIIELAKRNKFNIHSSVDGFIVKVALRKWGKKLKKSIDNRELQIDDDYTSDIDPLIEEVEDPKHFGSISRWLDELSDSCKRLIEEFHYYGCDWKHIAENLGYKSAASAKNQKYKCIEKLRLIITADIYNT
jgi:RNA polymerase sigma factor (sigma-70 family)